MNKNIVFFFLIFFVFSFVCSINNEVSENNSGESFDTGAFLKAIEIEEYRIEIFGFWGEKPGFLEKIFSKKDRNFDVIIESQGIKIFPYEELNRMIVQIRDELKSLYIDGARIRIIKIKDKEK
jgi:hypothetical protein